MSDLARVEAIVRSEAAGLRAELAELAARLPPRARSRSPRRALAAAPVVLAVADAPAAPVLAAGMAEGPAKERLASAQKLLKQMRNTDLTNPTEQKLTRAQRDAGKTEQDLPALVEEGKLAIEQQLAKINLLKVEANVPILRCTKACAKALATNAAAPAAPMLALMNTAADEPMPAAAAAAPAKRLTKQERANQRLKAVQQEVRALKMDAEGCEDFGQFLIAQFQENWDCAPILEQSLPTSPWPSSCRL